MKRSKLINYTEDKCSKIKITPKLEIKNFKTKILQRGDSDISNNKYRKP